MNFKLFFLFICSIALISCATNKHSQNFDTSISEPLNDRFVLTDVDRNPEIIGGMIALQRKITFPKKAVDAKVEGKVVVQFLIKKDGSVTNYKITESLGYGCDEVALEAVKSLSFKSGIKDGVPVDVLSEMPIWFKTQP